MDKNEIQTLAAGLKPCTAIPSVLYLAIASDKRWANTKRDRPRHASGVALTTAVEDFTQTELI